ncbi:LysE family translocator [Vibrio sp. SCSIO 43136]|uniref:LysE family translocator n=1 Tax=Vibrio sp. SCSIO 43136 TaxID=2819101 RepID=UPI002074B1BC|nr:LysE family translocator [Vibrio sp. SCSIO 43136]USD66467.1 LysE family translocator [Vibrio sp. SCSIO 43136]
MNILNPEAFLIAITILTLTPGLDTALVIRNTTRSGGFQGCLTSLGVCAGLFVHATFSAIGISAILLQSAELFMLVKSIGAAYLIWLGINSLKAMWQGEAGIRVANESQHKAQWQQSLKEGFLSNVLNPKTGVFYLAFLPQFINPEHSALLQSFTMAAIHFLIAMVWQCGLAATVDKAKTYLSNGSAMRWLEGVTGAVLVGLGIKLMIEK